MQISERTNQRSWLDSGQIHVISMEFRAVILAGRCKRRAMEGDCIHRQHATCIISKYVYLPD